MDQALASIHHEFQEDGASKTSAAALGAAQPRLTARPARGRERLRRRLRRPVVGAGLLRQNSLTAIFGALLVTLILLGRSGFLTMGVGDCRHPAPTPSVPGVSGAGTPCPIGLANLLHCLAEDCHLPRPLVVTHPVPHAVTGEHPFHRQRGEKVHRIRQHRPREERLLWENV